MHLQHLRQDSVAPYMGAWIEISLQAGMTIFRFVAPYMGAWIEIFIMVRNLPDMRGRSLHGSVD